MVLFNIKIYVKNLHFQPKVPPKNEKKKKKMYYDRIHNNLFIYYYSYSLIEYNNLNEIYINK